MDITPTSPECPTPQAPPRFIYEKIPLEERNKPQFQNLWIDVPRDGRKQVPYNTHEWIHDDNGDFIIRTWHNQMQHLDGGAPTWYAYKRGDMLLAFARDYDYNPPAGYCIKIITQLSPSPAELKSILGPLYSKLLEDIHSAMMAETLGLNATCKRPPTETFLTRISPELF